MPAHTHLKMNMQKFRCEEGSVASNANLYWSAKNRAKLIKLYMSESLLWNPNDPHFGQKSLRKEAVQRIIRNMQMPGLQSQDVISKINGLRSGYSKQLRLQLETLKDGEIAEPTWEPFEALDSFLRPIVCQRNNWENIPSVNINKKKPDTGSDLKKFDSASMPQNRMDDTLVRKSNNTTATSLNYTVFSPEKTPVMSNLSIMHAEGADEAFCEHLKYLMRYVPPGKNKMEMHIQMQQLVMNHLELT